MPRSLGRPLVAARARATPMVSDLLLLLALAAALLVIGCESSPTNPDQGELEFQTLAKAQVEGVGGPAHVREIVRDQARLDALWRELWGGRGAEPPQVAFGREMVVAVSAGGGCFDDVTVERIALRSDELVVELVRPQPTLCLCTAVARSQFHLVRLRRLEAGARYQERTVAPLC